MRRWEGCAPARPVSWHPTAGTPPAHRPTAGTPPAHRPTAGTPPAHRPTARTLPAHRQTWFSIWRSMAFRSSYSCSCNSIIS